MSSSTSGSEDESAERNTIREDLSSMSFEEILALKEKLGAKVYKEAVLGVDNDRKTKSRNPNTDLKRLNKNRPREISSRRQVPFLGAELRTQKKTDAEIRDPRFDEKSGTYDVVNFKKNYKFLSNIRAKEITLLQKKLSEAVNEDERMNIKTSILRLKNKNVEDRSWHTKQRLLKQEQLEIQKSHLEGMQPHYMKKKERRAKELVAKFEQLKKVGSLNKHLEKRRKKNASKDRKKFSFD